MDDFMWQGKLLALPIDTGYAFLEYNKALFQKSGSPDPTTLWQQGKWDWNAFVAAAQAALRVSTPEAPVWGFQNRLWEGDYLSILRSFGADVLSDDRTRFVLGEGAGPAAVTTWAELATKLNVSPPPDREPKGGFTSGQIAMYSQAANNIRNNQKTIKDAGGWGWDTVPHPPPAGKKPVPALFTNGVYLWNGTKQLPTVLEVLKFLISPSALLSYGSLTGRDPARAPLVAENAKGLGLPQNDPKSYVKLYQDMTPLARGIPWTVNYLEWQDILYSEAFTPILKGQKSVQEALQAVTPKINAILQRK
jgi:ABC-type glycerol-3-phosphate transport system substrate-binding protein